MRNYDKNQVDAEESNLFRTYGDLRKYHNKFISLCQNKKIFPQTNSTINRPLFEESDEMSVLEKCVIPELHVMQGFVNHLFWDGLVPLVGREKALLWPKKLKIISKNYHGEIFEGNACRKLLKEADKIIDKEIHAGISPLLLVPYVSAFKTMDKIVNFCFSTKRTNPIDNIDKLLI